MEEEGLDKGGREKNRREKFNCSAFCFFIKTGKISRTKTESLLQINQLFQQSGSADGTRVSRE